MKKNFLFFSLCFLFVEAWSQPVQVSLEQSDESPIISRHIYGHFAEHLGRCIYGGFYVGAESSIPNTNGVRNDVVTALKDLKIPNLRWPGGCFADTYHWKDGIGPKEDRPSILNIWWGNVTEDNSFGTHEFLNMCELLETEPYLSANVGSGTVQELDEWIKYTTLPEGTGPMPNLRAKNGRKEPWNVSFWGVGNETWGCGGNMRAEYYADIYRQYATFMKGDGIIRIASGASSGDYEWTETLMKNVPKHLIEAIALHHYSVIDWSAKGSAKDFTEEHYFSTMQRALEMEDLIKNHVAIMDKYDPKKEVDLYVDEWGGWYDVEPGTNPAFLYQQNTMRDAMLAGTTLNSFNNHADRVKMANIAQAINVLQAVILTDEEKLLLTPTYHVFKMYNVHHDAQLIPVSFVSPQYIYKNEFLPAVSISASKNSQDNIHISIVNIDSKKTHPIEIDLNDYKVTTITGEILTAENLQDHNTFDLPDKIKTKDFNGAAISNNRITLQIPPFSIIVLSAK